MPSINIMSLNIRFENPHDGAHAWEKRLPIMVEILNRYSIDLLATQEGRAPQIKELASQLPQLAIIDGHRKWITERMYPVLYYNSSSIKIIDSGDIWLSETPDVAASSSFESEFPRLCTWAKMEYLQSKKQFFALNCHLDHKLEKTRELQAQVLVNEVKKINSNNLPYIIMGDFNTGPKSKVRETMLNLKQNEIIDPWIEFNIKEESSYHKFKGAYPQGSRIDWIMLSKMFRASQIKLIKDNQRGIYPSDHFGVYCKIDL